MSSLLLSFVPLIVIGWEWAIVAIVLILLFGGKKIPELMKGLGAGIRNFKEGMNQKEN